MKTRKRNQGKPGSVTKMTTDGKLKRGYLVTPEKGEDYTGRILRVTHIHRNGEVELSPIFGPDKDFKAGRYKPDKLIHLEEL